MQNSTAEHVNPVPSDPPQCPSHSNAGASRLREVAGLFLKLGFISFGGPAAHIALMEEEVVHKRQWVTRQQFLDMLGAANLIPGPSSTELAINIGFVRAGWMGLCAAGASFILPAALITAAFAWAYVRFGSTANAVAILAGVKPAVLAVIAIAIWRLGKVAVRGMDLATLGAIALAVFLVGLNPIAILLGGGALGAIVIRWQAGFCAGGISLVTSLIPPIGSCFGTWFASWRGVAVVAEASSAATARPSTLKIGLFFLKVGALLYGGGYVLLAFLEQGLVHQNTWLTQKQLLDSVAIGQFTPGPVFSTATFIGYLLGGAPGAAVATVAIFLPSFLYVALLAPFLLKLRQSPWMAAFLDSVNVCAVALMVGVTYQLGADALRSSRAWVIALVALAALWRWKLNPAWIVLAGGIAGVLLAHIG
jgi:chromate transporter